MAIAKFELLQGKVKSMRVPVESEEEGLDVPEFGMPAYPEDALVPTPY